MRFVVIGAGTMGVGIGYVATGAGFTVELVEVDAGRAAEALSVLDGLWRGAVERGRLTRGGGRAGAYPDQGRAGARGADQREA